MTSKESKLNKLKKELAYLEDLPTILNEKEGLPSPFYMIFGVLWFIPTKVSRWLRVRKIRKQIAELEKS